MNFEALLKAHLVKVQEKYPDHEYFWQMMVAAQQLNDECRMIVGNIADTLIRQHEEGQ